MAGPTRHERKDSKDLATFARPTTVKAVEGSDHHNSTGKDISRAQRASLEHIAQATLALMGEPIHVHADSAKSSSGAAMPSTAQEDHAHMQAAELETVSGGGQSDGVKEYVKVESEGEQLKQDKKESTTMVAGVKDVTGGKHSYSCEDVETHDSLDESVVRGNSWLRLLDDKEGLSEVARGISMMLGRRSDCNDCHRLQGAYVDHACVRRLPGFQRPVECDIA